MKRDIWLLTGLSLSMLVGCQDDFDRGVPVTTVAGSAEAASFQGGQDWPQWRGIRPRRSQSRGRPGAKLAGKRPHRNLEARHWNRLFRDRRK